MVMQAQTILSWFCKQKFHTSIAKYFEGERQGKMWGFCDRLAQVAVGAAITTRNSNWSSKPSDNRSPLPAPPLHPSLRKSLSEHHQTTWYRLA
jgi:hypothetical protein